MKNEDKKFKVVFWAVLLGLALFGYIEIVGNVAG